MKFFLKLVVWLMVLAVSAAIFGFSSQPAEQSSEVSRGIVVKVLEKSVSGYNDMPKAEKTNLIKKYHNFVRKLAHYSLYTLWGILTSCLFQLYNIKRYRQIILTVAAGFIFAGSDEIHQLFVPGRSGQFTDVLLDTIGVLTGCCINALVVYMLGRRLKFIKKNN